MQGGHCEAAGGDPRHDLPDLLVPGGLLDCLWSSQSEPFFLLQDGIEELEDPTTVSLLKSAIHTPEVIIQVKT